MIEIKVYIVVGGFILFDVATGILKALKKGKLNSTALRLGLFHKLSEVLAVAGSTLLEAGAKTLDIGFDIPAHGIVAAYICAMEFISVCENLSEINPALAKLFAPYLEKLKGKDDENESKNRD